MPTPAHIKEKLPPVVSDISIDDEGIMHLVLIKDPVISLSDMEIAFEIYSRMGYGPGKKKIRQIITGTNFFSMTKEARDYSGKLGKSYFVAVAIVSKSVALKFVLSIFSKVNGHGVPYKMFPGEKEALEWLRTFKTETAEKNLVLH